MNLQSTKIILILLILTLAPLKVESPRYRVGIDRIYQFKIEANFTIKSLHTLKYISEKDKEALESLLRNGQYEELCEEIKKRSKGIGELSEFLIRR